MPEPTVIRVINEFRAALLARDARQMIEMAKRWQQVEHALAGAIDALAQDIAARRAAGETVTTISIAELARYRSLLAQTRVEIEKYIEYATTLITAQQREAGRVGIEQALQSLRALYDDISAVVPSFDVLPIETIESMAGLAGDGSPLRTLLENAWPDAVDGMTRELTTAIARGRNPRQTAAAMTNGLADGLNRALVIARTEQLRVYREATRQQYKSSGVVVGYRRVAAKQLRTCMACLMLDGKIYSLDTPFEDHPNGRCTAVPIIVGMDPVRFTTGRDYFLGLNAAQQQKMMGKQVYDAWKAGGVQLEKLAKIHTDPVWGNSPRVATLSDLGIGD